MREYAIFPLDAPLPAVLGEAFHPDSEPFCQRPFAPIDRYVWPGDYRPEARAYAAWNHTGLCLLLCAREAQIAALPRPFGGDVYLDSCLECFLQPFGDDPRYLNIEINAAGSALMGFGRDRERRVRLPEMPSGVAIRAGRGADDWWAAACELPFAAIEALYGRAFDPGQPFRGNFYCCDETLHPHFGSWAPISALQPDFHRPECFGRLTLVSE